MDEREEVIFDVPARPDAVRDAREAVCKTVTEWGFGSIADDLIVCLSEALTNSITHAAHGETVAVLVRREGPMVHVEVVDCDDRRPTSIIPAEVQLSDPLPTRHQPMDRGRGMFLIKMLSSRWGVESRSPGKCVWFEKDACLIGVAG
ncbi:ATP-binding protein [Streptomyces sp. SPB074]|uniref:ATP-binding protein n=1 Tax=Streptomyces sp. (strain SPB074) TaxID=465543 RepID=UPI00017F1E80|nr:ATP-binding protein [Streptomyces sp. SPB074]